MKYFRLVENAIEEISKSDLVEYINNPFYTVAITKMTGAVMVVKIEPKGEQKMGKIWIAEGFDFERGFTSEEKAKNQCITWFKENAEEAAKWYGYSDFNLDEAIDELIEEHYYEFISNGQDNTGCIWYQIDMGE